MHSVRTTGRWLGLLILLGYAADIVSNFWLQPGIRLSDGPLGMLEGAAQQPDRIALIVLLGLASSFASLIMAGLICGATLGRPTFAIALVYLGVVAAAQGMGGAELAAVQMMRSVGEAVAQSPSDGVAASAESLQLLIRSLRNGLHFPHLLTGGFSALLAYVVLWRSRFIPSLLGLLGVAASLSQMTGVFTGVMGREVHFGFLMPLAVVHLVLALWLLTFGFDERGDPASDPTAPLQPGNA